jgi:DNA-binding HxlR family transcriptional regulator
MSITTKNPICKASLKLFGDYWTMMIIDMLSDGPMRFRDLEQKIDNVNTATLTNRLKNMQASQLIERKEYSRADVVYELTELGKKAVPILNAVNDFSGYATKTSKSSS